MYHRKTLNLWLYYAYKWLHLLIRWYSLSRLLCKQSWHFYFSVKCESEKHFYCISFVVLTELEKQLFDVAGCDLKRCDQLADILDEQRVKVIVNKETDRLTLLYRWEMNDIFCSIFVDMIMGDGDTGTSGTQFCWWNVVDSLYSTCCVVVLYRACVLKRAGLVQWLIEHGADPEYDRTSNQTPLYAACRNDNIEAVTILLQVCSFKPSITKSPYSR